MARTLKVKEILDSPLLDGQTEVTIMEHLEDEDGVPYTKHTKGRSFSEQIIRHREADAHTVTISTILNSCRISI